MSYYEAQDRNINLSAPRDISDEILGAAIKFSQETGYSGSIAVINYFWCAFMLCAKDELSKHGLFANVINCHLSSLSQVFPNLAEDLDLRETINEMYNNHLSFLSSMSPSDFSEGNANTFFGVANQLHAKGNPGCTAPDIENSREVFSRISLELCFNIKTLVYRSNTPFNAVYCDTLNEVISATRQQNAKGSKPHKKANIPWERIICGIAVIGLCVWAALTLIFGDSDPDLIAVEEPASGTILSGKEYYQASEITISASEDSSWVVKLKTAAGTSRLSFYVRAGDTVTVGVPAERLYVYFASGKEWYGPDHLFGQYTDYSMDDELLDFSEYIFEYNLYPVSDGNFTQTLIDAAEFN